MLPGGPAVLPELVDLVTVLLVAEGFRVAGVLVLGFVAGLVVAAPSEVTLPPDAPGCAEACKPNVTKSTMATSAESTTLRLRLRNDAR